VAQIDELVKLRLDAPRPEEIGLELAEWLADEPARELALRIERLEARRLLGAPEDCAETGAIQRAWPRLCYWLRPPGRVRITTPLVLAYDPRRQVFGLSRIVLPRSAGGLAGDGVPLRPYALDLLRWMVGLEPFAVDAASPSAPDDTPLARALRGASLESLDYAAEPLPPAPGDPAPAAPVARHRFRLGLLPPAAPDVEVLEVVADTLFRTPTGWDGTDPTVWTRAHGPLLPERLVPRCYVPAEDRPPGPIERALATAGVPACS
jgi:hypothetical protein